MKNQYSRLMRVNHSYYVRVAIPRDLQLIAKKKQFKYSLRTNSYYNAINRLRITSTFFDKILEFYKVLNMKVHKENNSSFAIIDMEDNDIDKILMYRLEQIENFAGISYTKIKMGSNKWDDISLITEKEKEAYINEHQEDDSSTINDNINFNAAVKLFYDYILYCLEAEETLPSFKTLLKKYKNGNATFNIPTHPNNAEHLQTQPFYKFNNLLKEIEEYGSIKIESIYDGENFETDHPLIKSYLRTIQTKNDERRQEKQIVKTKWATLFKSFIDDKKINSRGFKYKTIKSYETKLKCCFDLLQKSNIEDVSFEDAKKITELLRRTPSNWSKKFPNKKITEVLFDEQNMAGSYSDKTVQTYIVLFKEFMKYGYKNIKGNTSNVFEDIRIPKVEKQIKKLPFEDDDLLRIFNPDTYFNRYDRNEFARFWVPIISLYTGARVNEIAQLKLADIITFKGIDCFYIHNENDNDDEVDENERSIKNSSSKRIIPIHSEIIRLGFLDFVNKLKNAGKTSIFYTLKNTASSNHGDDISKKFSIYLRHTVGIKTKRKTFHSFRNTFTSELTDNDVITDIAENLGGWKNNSVRQNNYLFIKVKKLQEAIEKIRYPFWEKVVDNFLFNPNIIDNSIPQRKNKK